ncbi:Pre-mRNA cleavage complex II protein Clp1-domain-containing protein [Suillus subalutaceus]|uniref:Pre-mRNA cleavage complex II protein Clp1-domain-containing protein n=1 Tax=Suillus subalutaceus TaxID=48586 RepID=UPI001B85F2BC|nr:Pre-mRNA cleavage complex II protein Clp1-domain-containing protein [Suillus subalutaceus]KAG1838633.1 Pre-mRNA cleavage complex II protein Clp1-domain-containing protein [Suillus subalutaceus]
MLSAIAVRRAAQAALESSQPSSSKQPSPLPTPSTSSPDPNPEPKRPNPPSKRKSSSVNGKPSRNSKKAKIRPGRVSATARYFESKNMVEGGGDVIMLESSSDSEPDVQAKLALDSSDDSEAEETQNPLVSIELSLYPQPSRSEPSQLSTFRPTRDLNVYELSADEANATGLQSETSVLSIDREETLALLGTYALTVLKGSVSILGVTLSASKVAHHVFVPRSAPIPILRCASSDVHADLNIYSLPPRIRHNHGGAVVAIQSLDTGVEGLGRICRVFDGVFEPSRWQRSSAELIRPGVSLVTHSTRDVLPFVLPESWSIALSAAETPPSSADPIPLSVYVVKGPKKSGKSTFARTLLNRLLARFQRVAYLECDVGQSEFTPGGLVALNVIDNPVFGPPFTHPSLPYRAHYVGATSPRCSPAHYLAAVQALLETYKLEVQTSMPDDESIDTRVTDITPLVINTMGWTKGLGADLNAKIEELAEPTHVFEIIGPEEKGWPTAPPTYDTLYNQSAPSKAFQYTLEAISPHLTNTHFNAVDQRNLNILSYFHAIFPSITSASFPSPSAPLRQMTATKWETSHPLCARYPYEVDWSQAFDQVILIGAGYEDVIPSEISNVLNGAIVGLVECEPGTEDPVYLDPSGARELPYAQARHPPAPSTSTCHGLALIRAISPSSSHMHILTPVPPAILARCRVIVKGELELPIWGMLDFTDANEGVAGVEKGRVPYLQWGKSEGLGGERRRVRRNLMRKAQM